MKRSLAYSFHRLKRFQPSFISWPETISWLARLLGFRLFLLGLNRFSFQREQVARETRGVLPRTSVTSETAQKQADAGRSKPTQADERNRRRTPQPPSG